jgi:D-glycero-alpha-D-manno-heptose 1-phosphate guanylyltransferase
MPGMQAIILAGGKGTRLRAEVPDLPKPLAPVDGRPFLEHQMSYWARQGVDRFILSVGYMAERIIETIGNRFGDATVDYAVEYQPLGTGGAVLFAMQRLSPNQPFLVVNGDTFFDVPLSDLQRFHRDKNSDWTLGLFRTNDGDRYMGVSLDKDERLIALVGGDHRGEVWANGGVYLISPGALDLAAERFKGEVSLEAGIIPALLALKSAVYGFRHQGRFIDIGVPADYRRAAKVLGPVLAPVLGSAKSRSGFES